MIARLRGELVARDVRDGVAHVVLDVRGVGYVVLVPAGAVLPDRGAEVTLHTSLQVREDSMTLYGFPTLESRDLFEMLLNASGVGPRIALAALSTHPPGALVRAIAEEDHDALVLVPGVGKKLAQRLILELRDKVGVVPSSAAPGGASPGTPADDPREEVRLALIELGYSAAEAHRTLAGLEGDGDAAELLRAALRSLSSAARP